MKEYYLGAVHKLRYIFQTPLSSVTQNFVRIVTPHTPSYLLRNVINERPFRYDGGKAGDQETAAPLI